MTRDIISDAHKLALRFALLSIIFAFALALPAGSAQIRRQPLTEAEITQLLKSKTPGTDLLASIRQQKISFVVTKSVIDNLKAAGASRDVLEAVRAAQPVGLVWSAPTRVSLSHDAMVEVTPLVVDGGHEYFACTNDVHRLALVTNAAGAWKLYPVAPDLSVGNNVGARIIGLAVHQGVAYIAMIPNASNIQLILAYNPGGNPAGPWVQVPIYSTDSSSLENPALAIAGPDLLVAFDDINSSKGSNDIFLGKIPLSSLTANSKTPSVSFTPLTKADDSQGGPSDMRPQMVTSQGQLNIAWEQSGKSVIFAQAQFASGLDSLQQTQNLHTVSDPTDKSLALAATGNTALVARFADDSNPGNVPGCCVVFATTNVGGSWSTSSLGRTNLALEAPGLAVGQCGPSLAYLRALAGNSQRLTVATFADGQWRSQDLGVEDAHQPRFAANASNLDLVYISAVGQIAAQSAACYPPPAPLD